MLDATKPDAKNLDAKNLDATKLDAKNRAGALSLAQQGLAQQELARQGMARRDLFQDGGPIGAKLIGAKLISVQLTGANKARGESGALLNAAAGGDDRAARDGTSGDETGSRPLAGRRILLIEDDFFIGFELAQFLTSLGADVAGPFATTQSGREAMNSGEIDGALLDVNLGRETSLPLARELHAAGVPFLFVTAYAEEDGLFEGELKSAPRLGKPVARAVLRRRAAEIFG